MRRLMIAPLVLLGAGCGSLTTDPPSPPTEQGKPAVVFDIDGTLTPYVLSIFDVRPDAARAVCLYAQKGYQIIYLSTRNKRWQKGLPDWLKKNRFPSGALHLPARDDDQDFDYPDEFKKRILQQYKRIGWDIRYAYGDSHTDFVAYAAANIPKEGVFALQPDKASKCEPGDTAGCLANWSGHLSFIRDKVPSVPLARREAPACEGF